jgi:hypothetical protein
MHPPFGFALFYLRGIAPPAVKSSAIYWGAVPWVFLQLLVAAIVILWPELVTSFLSQGLDVDPSTITIEVPGSDEPTADEPDNPVDTEEELNDPDLPPEDQPSEP